MDDAIGSNYKPGPSGKSPLPALAPNDPYEGYKNNADMLSEQEKFGTDQNPVREIAPPFRISGGGGA